MTTENRNRQVKPRAYARTLLTASYGLGALLALVAVVYLPARFFLRALYDRDMMTTAGVSATLWLIIVMAVLGTVVAGGAISTARGRGYIEPLLGYTVAAAVFGIAAINLPVW